MKAPNQLACIAALGSALTMGVGLTIPCWAQTGGPPAEKAGAAHLDDSEAQAPIAVEQSGSDGDKSVLRVRNRTPFIVLVYIGGVRVGWMRPYRTAILRGLTSGYHQMYAHSRFGKTSWGPRPIWVPGAWNLLF